MSRVADLVRTIHASEEGHALPAVAALVGAAGAVVLGIGAANDSGGLAIAGGIITAVGIVAASLLDHIKVDYGIFDRLNKLEKK